jgi:hypothetical protein
LTGVVIRLGSEASDNSNDLLDMTRSSKMSDPALDVEGSYFAPGAGVTITQRWEDGISASVSVSFGSGDLRKGRQ